ncbi:MAG TPA: DUF998 domain-containing protein [Kineosporiaceae bacterium]|nr:DUF998 domain-containing protein [Kineosporiaceae bacterium]
MTNASRSGSTLTAVPAGSGSVPGTRRLLVGGLAAGPLFAVVVAGQARLRDGFDLRRHPLSLLALGSWGWIQTLNFLLTGLLLIGLAVGLHRVLSPGRGTTWAPILLGAHGVGLLIAGTFPSNPALGFPPGTPDGAGGPLSWHAVLHGVGFFVAFTCLAAVCVVLVRRFLGAHRPGWAAYSVATAVVALGLAAWPGLDGASIRYAFAGVVAWAWTTALAARLLITDLP